MKSSSYDIVHYLLYYTKELRPLLSFLQLISDTSEINIFKLFHALGKSLNSFLDACGIP